MCAASTLSISSFRTASSACTLSISCFDTAGKYLPVLSGFRTAYSQSSQYLGLLSTRNITVYIMAASTPILSVLRLRVALEHLSVKPLFYPERQEFSFCGNIPYTSYVLDSTQPVTKYSVATSTSRNFFVFMFTPQVLN